MAGNLDGKIFAIEKLLRKFITTIIIEIFCDHIFAISNIRKKKKKKKKKILKKK